MGLLCQVSHPLWFRYGFSFSASGFRTDNHPFYSSKIYRTNVIEHRLKCDMIMSRANMLPQCRNSILFFAGSNSHAEPGVVQMSVEIDFFWPFGQKQILVLRVSLHLGEHLVPPLWSPTGKITHTSEQKNLWPGFLHQPQFSREVLRILKVINHVKPPYIISGIAVTTADSTADNQIHVLNLGFNAHRHWNSPSRFLPQSSTAGATLPKPFQA